MSNPTTPRTVRPIIVHSSPDFSVDQVDEGPFQYRIEERRRTIFVTSSEPSLHLNPQALDELFKLADSPGRDSRRLSVAPTLRARPDDSPARPRRFLHKKNASVVLPTSPQCSLPPSPSSTSSRSSGFQSLIVNPPRKILFYHKHDPHYGFTNFSPHPVIYKGKRYPTSEHLFQSFKFQEHRPLLAEHIRTCSELPSIAFSEARRFQPEVRKDWKDVNIEKMDETLWHKFTQHQDLKEELLATGSAELVEDSDKDAFWGVGADGKGRNELGKALERLRAKLREPC